MPKKYLSPTNIYHITSLENLPSIIENDLLANSSCSNCRIKYSSIAHSNIQDKREITKVTITPYGNLHDYVPFYFAPRSPMLYTISRGNVEGYKGDQRQIIHLVSSVQVVISRNIPFVFTDGHAIMHLTNFYNKETDLEYIDWQIMEEKYWCDTNEDGDRKRRRQAEFLVHRSFPWSLVDQIGSIGKEIAEQVNNYILNSVHKPEIVINKNWYY